MEDFDGKFLDVKNYNWLAGKEEWRVSSILYSQ